MNEGIFYHIISFCLGSSSSPLPVLCTFILVTIVCFLAVLKLQFYNLRLTEHLQKLVHVLLHQFVSVVQHSRVFLCHLDFFCFVYFGVFVPLV